ncbi:hypothetical protein PsorP6_017149 [Peronosclerospora sorghi]|uniref:Uncharacterized protein n=1 Tax=Peronosclerospora sorghi TaxID=230839 RepID=A0ACC0WDT5_9STRA|nr:hypothetical protein PsorP6_017149 [Peronosclerospora sorghi]
MESIDRARQFSLWLVVYVVAGITLLMKLLGDALSHTLTICAIYPHFSFFETLTEEMAMHSTWLPLVRVRVPTLHLVGVYFGLYLVKHSTRVDPGWPFLVDVLSGRWLYALIVEFLPEFLPFGSSEPDVPELVSEDEDSPRIATDDEDEVKNLSSRSVDTDACNVALAKLVQVKMQHAHRTVPRPDDWLVFDPVQEKLVLQNRGTLANHGTTPRSGEQCHDSQGNRSQEQAHCRDRDDGVSTPSVPIKSTGHEQDVRHAFPDKTRGIRKRPFDTTPVAH